MTIYPVEDNKHHFEILNKVGPLIEGLHNILDELEQTQDVGVSRLKIEDAVLWINKAIITSLKKDQINDNRFVTN